MSLPIGSRFGAFEVRSLLGVGGMGEVYLARDTRLGRDIALKIIPEQFAGDADRLDRLDREARALAALNHPAIATIHDIVDVDGARALVLELVDGETLDEQLRRGPLTVEQAVTIAHTLADALDAAHDKGLIHRDLKPANIKLTSGGDVKILDFGLAKMLLDTERSADASTVEATGRGIILGTAAYMSPEQARGHAVDKRADVWAFGCVLFEMLAGRPAFKGESWSDSIARTLTAEPEWSALPPDTHAGIIRVIERCLQKEPRKRLRGLGGVELSLSTTGPRVEAPRQPRRRVLTVGVAMAALAVAVVSWTLWPLPSPAANPAPVRFEVPPAIQMPANGSFALSPDGRRFVFTGTGADGAFRMWERSLDSLDTRPINGTEGEVATNTTLFWSPDNRFIGFYANRAIRRIDRDGGVAQIVCPVNDIAVGGTWNSRGDIVIGNTAGGLLRCSATGGTPAAVTADSGLHLFPAFLPDGRHVLYLRVSRTDPTRNGLYVADIDTPPERQRNERLIETGFAGRFAPTTGAMGHLLFVRNRGVWAVPFDSRRRALAGEPVEVVPSVGTFRDAAFFDTNGSTLVHRGGTPDYQVEWRDRTGQVLGTVGEPGQYSHVSLSPDGTRAAVVRENRANRSDQDIWLLDLQRNTTTRLTSDPLPESIPAWSPDSRSLWFAVGHDSADIRMRSLDGTERMVVRGTDLDGVWVNPLLTTLHISADGRWLTFSTDTRGPTRSDLWMLPLNGSAAPALLLRQEFDQIQPSVSPDRRWLAYVSNEAGANEVFVRALTDANGTGGIPTLGSPTLVSRDGGRSPRWRADSRELFYQTLGGAIMSVGVSGDSFTEPSQLFTAPGALFEWGVTPDGQRFLLALPADNSDLPFAVVLNWMAGQ